MPTRLYLDSARMGLVSERARLAQQAFFRLAATEGCSLYFSEILESGFGSGPHHAKDRYPELADWRGIPELKSALKGLLGADESADVLLANRTAQLVRMAIGRLCDSADSVFVSDTLWPSYRKLLDEVAGDRCVPIVEGPIRLDVRAGASMALVVDNLVHADDKSGFDALFLPVISHDGIRLPVDTICRRFNEIRPLKFVVLDGAQAIGHLTDELGLRFADYWIAGTHKWLGGFLPMGIALSACDSATCSNDCVDDPLLRFTTGLESGDGDSFSETVNLASLFTCRAAIADVVGPSAIARRMEIRLENASRVESLARNCGWNMLSRLLPSGIVILQTSNHSSHGTRPDDLRRFLAGFSVSVSAYDQETIRLSMPRHALTAGDLDLLEWALQCWHDDTCERGCERTQRRSLASRRTITTAVN